MHFFSIFLHESFNTLKYKHLRMYMLHKYSHVFIFESLTWPHLIDSYGMFPPHQS